MVQTISKGMILKEYTEIEIYTKFLNVATFPKGNISSPFSVDKKASFKVYQNGTFKCNSTGLHGDVWQFVASLNNLDCKTQFNDLLIVVAEKMNLILDTVKLQSQNIATVSIDIKSTKQAEKLSNSLEIDKLQQNNNTIAITTIAKKLSIEKRQFTENDFSYWSNLGVNLETLKQFNCYSIKSYCWTGKKPIYTKKEAVAFAWELDGNFKLYIPSQPIIGVVKNVLPPFKSGIFGFEQLGKEKIKNLIICAGEKDTITANSRGFNTVTFGSETNNPKDEEIKKLQLLCENLFVCYDNDEPGENGRNAIIKRFPQIISLQLPKNEKIKGFDITDYFQENSAQDFQKIIDLAVKNKSVVELQQESAKNSGSTYDEYELPTEISEPINMYINDIKKYQLFMANNKIWILKVTDKKKYFKDISNFELEILQHMQDEKYSLKLIRLKNVHQKEVVFDVLSDRLNSVAKLDETVTSFGNFLFTGNATELNLLRAYLFDKMGIGKKIDCLGLQEEFDFWVWNNTVNLMNGEVLKIDKNGMFKYKENSFYIPSSNSIYKFNNSKYINQKKFKMINPNTTIENYFKLWYNVYKEHAISSILFTLSSIFQDIIVNETKSFPILFLQGGTSSGKDNLAYCCQSFFGTPQDKISIGAGVSTQKAQIRELAQFTNGISQFSEYKTGDKSTDEILKGIWDRNGYKMGTIESKVSTDVVPISSSLIVTSNYTPVDEALISRLLWVNIEKNSFTTDENILYEELKNTTYFGISGYTDILLHHRNVFKNSFKKMYIKNKELFSTSFGSLPIRVASNYAVLKSTYDIFNSIIEFPFNENEIIYQFKKSASFIGDKIKSSSLSVKWWDCFYECLKSSFENKIQLDTDFKINGNEITFNFSAVYGKIQRQWYNQFKENIPNKDTIKKVIENHNAFTENKKSDRLNKQVTSTMTFDVSKLENSEILLEHFNYILNVN